MSRLCLLLAAASALAPLHAHVAEPEPEKKKKAEAVVVVESKPTPVDAHNPAPTEGFDAIQLREGSLVNTEDAAKYLPNVLVRKRFVGDRNGVISGRNSNSIQSAAALVYADGLLLSNFLGNNYNFGPRWGTVAPEEIERVDLIYGPYSALYPGNSMGVTAWITTREPEKLEASVKLQGFSQSYADEYGYARTFRGFQTSAWMGDRLGRFSYSVGVNHLTNDGQPMQYATVLASATATGTGPTASGARSDLDPTNAKRSVLGPTNIEHTAQDQVKVRFGYFFTPDLHLSLTVAHWQNDYNRRSESFLTDPSGNALWAGRVVINGATYNLSASSPIFPFSAGSEATTLAGLTLKARLNPNWLVETILSGYQVEKDLLGSNTTVAPAGATGGPGQVADQSGTHWRTGDLKATGENIAGHHLALGLHWDHYSLNNVVNNASDWKAQTLTTLNSRFGGESETVAAYFQDAWTLSSRWSATLGLRAEHWKAEHGLLQSTTSLGTLAGRSESALSPKFSATWKGSEAWSLRLSLGQATRFPTVSELFQGSLVAGSIVNNDPNLKPERIFSKDLTSEWTFQSSTLRASLYEDDIRDRILRQTNLLVVPSITNLQNVARSRVRGLELSGHWANLLPGLDLQASASYTQALTLEDPQFPAYVDKRMTTVPRDRAALIATWRPLEAWSFVLAARHTGDTYSNPDNTDVNHNTFGGASSFTIVDLKANWKINRQFTAGLALDNAGSTRAFIYHPYPHRTWTGELRWAF